MKVLIDLEKLRDEGKISESDYKKLNQFAIEDTGSLAFNLLVGFGVIAVTSASIALVPSAYTAILLGMLISALGFSPLRQSIKWHLFSVICVLLGSLLLCGGILWLYEASVTSWVIITLLLTISGILSQSGLLIVLAVLALSSTIGAGAFYGFAMYTIVISEPGVTAILFGLLGYLTYQLSFRVSPNYQRLAILASRTSIFLVNLGLWVGSLWGDHLPGNIHIADWAFSLIWAILLIGTGVWAAKMNRRWVLNTCATFGAIHFYTQWFERLNTTPTTLLLAGMIALFFALGIRYLNTVQLKKID